MESGGKTLIEEVGEKCLIEGVELVAKKPLHATEKVRWLLVPKFLLGEQFLKARRDGSLETRQDGFSKVFIGRVGGRGAGDSVGYLGNRVRW